MKTQLLLLSALALSGCQQTGPLASARLDPNNSMAAVHECSLKAGRMNQHTWGVREISYYRSCAAAMGRLD